MTQVNVKFQVFEENRPMLFFVQVSQTGETEHFLDLCFQCLLVLKLDIHRKELQLHEKSFFPPKTC